MSDDLVERVAVALCEADDWGLDPYYESEPGYFFWHDYVTPAQAAIEAMQPEIAMLEAQIKTATKVALFFADYAKGELTGSDIAWAEEQLNSLPSPPKKG